ncbi:MAG: 2-keto-4-pentenoate hydratase [Paracoccaceae bacterium]
MSLTDETARIAAAVLNRDLIAAPGEGGVTFTLEDAYSVQDGVVDALDKAGHARAGAKIGLSAAAAQAAFGLSEPVSGILYSHMMLRDGAQIAAGDHRQPRVEAEICFRLGADLDVPDLSEEAALAAIAEVMPAIEVVDSRFDGWTGGPLDMLAENVAAAWFVCGAPVPGVDPAELDKATMKMFVDGEEVAVGAGAATHGGPLPALVWLARNLAKRGHPLKSGDYVMSGAFAAMHPVPSGSEVRVEIDGIGTVSVGFDA